MHMNLWTYNVFFWKEFMNLWISLGQVTWWWVTTSWKSFPTSYMLERSWDFHHWCCLRPRCWIQTTPIVQGCMVQPSCTASGWRWRNSWSKQTPRRCLRPGQHGRRHCGTRCTAVLRYTAMDSNYIFRSPDDVSTCTPMYCVYNICGAQFLTFLECNLFNIV